MKKTIMFLRPASLRILGQNLIILALTIYLQWDIFTLIFGYLLQTYILIFFTIAKLNRIAEKFPDPTTHISSITDVNNAPIQGPIKTVAGKFFRSTMLFTIGASLLLAYFSVHHKASLDLGGIFFIGLIFFFHQVLQWVEQSAEQKNLDVAMVDEWITQCVARILPTHITASLGGWFLGAFQAVPFLVLFWATNTYIEIYSANVKAKPATIIAAGDEKKTE